MYIETLTLKNFRCFEQAKITFNHRARQYPANPPCLPNVNLLLGENGSGKTSVFRAVVLSVLAPVIASSGFKAEFLVRRAPNIESAQCNTDLFFTREEKQASGSSLTYQATHIRLINSQDVIEPQEGVTTGFPLGLSTDPLYRDDSPAFFLAAYGASRRTERPEGYSERNRTLRYQRAASLFEDHVGLVPIAYATLQLQRRDRFEEARHLLNALLPDDVQLSDQSDTLDNPLFASSGTLLPFVALSDGYRTFIGWVWDLLVQLARVAPDGTKLVDLPGVVIVDEIDLFLHPRWQREVVQKVATTFPNLQFLFSTHSPIVATTLEPVNIFITEHGTVEQLSESISGKSIDEALTSPYFGLSSPRSPQLEWELSELAERAVNGDFQASLEYLRRLRTGTEASNGATVP